jgi:hypothetical protein
VAKGRFGREQKQRASNDRDYVYVMTSGFPASAAMTISFCCLYHPVRDIHLGVDDNIHSKLLSGQLTMDLYLISKWWCNV